MSIVEDVQQALDAYRSWEIGDADLARSLLRAAHQLAPSPATRAWAQTCDNHDLVEVDGDRDDVPAKQSQSNLTEADRQARKSARAAERARDVEILAQTRNELIQMLGGDRPEQSRSALCASVTHRRRAPRVLTEMLMDGTIIVVAPDVCALANNPQYQPKPKPHPDDGRIAAWLTDNEGASTDGDKTIQIIRVRLWGSAVPPTPIPPRGNGSNRLRASKSATAKTRLPVTLHSPVPYMGGKFLALSDLVRFMPTTIDEYREPFVGGGAVALAITAYHPKSSIWINDLNPAVHAFWAELQSNPDRLVKNLLDVRRGTSNDHAAKALVDDCKSLLKQGNMSREEAAMRFYIVQQLVHSGLGQFGRFSKSKTKSAWTENRIEKLRCYSEVIQNWRITNSDYADVMRAPIAGGFPFAYIDPPYDIKSRYYYRHAEFDHDEFGRAIRATQFPSLVSYNLSEVNKFRFADWNNAILKLRLRGNTLKTSNGGKRERLEYLFYNYPLPTHADS